MVSLFNFLSILQLKMKVYGFHSLVNSGLECSRGVRYMDVVEALLPYRNATKIFLPIFDFKIIFHASKY
jgi:hypothetical protein